MDPRRLVRWLDVGACILLYMTVGPALILVNKQILTTYGFGYPMLVSGLGQASSPIGATFVVKIMKWQPLSDQAQKMTGSFYRRNKVVVGAALARRPGLGQLPQRAATGPRGVRPRSSIFLGPDPRVSRCIAVRLGLAPLDALPCESLESSPLQLRRRLRP